MHDPDPQAPDCLHHDAVRVLAQSAETHIAWYCPACGAQLPPEFEPPPYPTRPTAKFCVGCGEWIPWPAHWPDSVLEAMELYGKPLAIPPHDCLERPLPEVIERFGIRD